MFFGRCSVDCLLGFSLYSKRLELGKRGTHIQVVFSTGFLQSHRTTTLKCDVCWTCCIEQMWMLYPLKCVFTFSGCCSNFSLGLICILNHWWEANVGLVSQLWFHRYASSCTMCAELVLAIGNVFNWVVSCAIMLILCLVLAAHYCVYYVLCLCQPFFVKHAVLIVDCYDCTLWSS